MSDVAISESLSGLLGQIASIRQKKDTVSAELKCISDELDLLEGLAAEQLRASGLDLCRAAGRSWWVDDTLRVSVPKENRDAVLEAAEAEGMAEELVAVQTATLKSWLAERMERAKAEGRAYDTPSKGTAFEGLVSEYVEIRLCSRKVG